MTVTRFAAIFVSALVYAVGAVATNAGDGWRIVESVGAVKVGGAAFLPVAVTKNQVLPADSWVETAASGRVVLMRGAESIAVGPNSRVYLPDEAVNGNTQVLQTLGSALYQIGKQKAPHFQVDTPYLAAVVKGTTFTVTVGEQATSVDVTEGVVEVATPDRADVEFVRAGFTGLVSNDRRGDVVVAPSDEGKASEPAKKSSNDKSAQSGRIVIPAVIGETNVDVKNASGGLASGVVEPTITPARAIKEAGEIGKDQSTLDVDKVGGAVPGVTKVVDVTPVPAIIVDPPVSVLTPVALDPVVDVVAPVVDVFDPVVDVVDVTPVVAIDPLAPDFGGGKIGVGVVVDVGGANGIDSGIGGVDIGIDVGVGTGSGVGVSVGVGGAGVGIGVSVGGGGGGILGTGLSLSAAN